MPDSDPTRTNRTNPPPPDVYKFLENEIAFERARKQEVFSWASSILVAIIGGITALTATNHTQLDKWPKILLTAAVGILCVASCIWIEVHWRAYLRARKRLSFYYDLVAPGGNDDPWHHDYTGVLSILGLSAVAIVAIRIHIGR